MAGREKLPEHQDDTKAARHAVGIGEPPAALAPVQTPPVHSCGHTPPDCWLRRAFFLDVAPLIALGYRTRLEPEHLIPDPSVATQRLYGNLESAWQEEQRQGRPELKRALLHGNVHTLLLTGALYLAAQACSLAGPLLLRQIVSGLQCAAAQRKQPAVDMACQPQEELYYFIIGLFLAPAIQSLCENHHNFLLYSLGTRMRNALMAAIYRKCLRLSSAALQAESAGKVVTLMSMDAQRLQEVMVTIHAMWCTPFYVLAVLALLWFEVGWATFVGLGVLLALVPLTGMITARLTTLRRRTMQWTDKRVSRTSELINGIQVVKSSAWEPPFRKAILDNRAQEARLLSKVTFWQGIFEFTKLFCPVAVALFTFGSLALAGGSLTPARAYTALALFSLLRLPMAVLPVLATTTANALVALRRIQGFLLRDEAAPVQCDPDKTPVGAVSMCGGTFTWDSDEEAPTLSDINLYAQPGSLTMVVGGAGSGKSSLLLALAGHMARREGKVEVGGRTAYVAQSAWVTNDTLQDNVLMGAPMDPKRYRTALEAAQLGPDLSLLPAGDATGVGDRGTALSGGQRQRVSMARALYADADVYLLDDPLSALDPHVGRALFEKAIRGVLRGKTVVLVTNALQYLQHADTILWMEGGQVRAQGSYQDLLEAGLGGLAELSHDEAVDDAEPEAPTDKGCAEAGGKGEALSAAPACAQGSPFLSVGNVLKGEHDVSAKASTAASSGRSHAAVAAAAAAVEGKGGTAERGETDGCSVQPPPMCNTQTSLPLGSRRFDSVRKFSSFGARGRSGADATLAPSLQRSRPIRKFTSFGARSRSGADASSDLSSQRSTSIRKFSSFGARIRSGAEATFALGSQRFDFLRKLSSFGARSRLAVEAREVGGISGAVIKTYFEAGGGLSYCAPMAVLFVAEQVARVYTDKWVGSWFGDTYGATTAVYLGVFVMLSTVYGMLALARSLAFLFFCVRASVNTHNRLLDHVLVLPKSFFDTNPAGRILNRFSRDTDIMDSTLPASLIQFSGTVATYAAILGVIAVATKWFGVALVPLTVIYFTIQRYYIPAARELQRIESITRSPIYSRFAEALSGVPTIRAHLLAAHLVARCDALLERNAHAFVTQKLAAGWLAMRLDVLGLAALTLAGMLCIQGGIEPGLAGLVLTYALELTRLLKHGTNMFSKSEADFNSVERIVQYLKPEPEAAPDTAPEVLSTMPKEWPSGGAIEVQDLHVRYRPGMPLVLQGVSFSVEAGQKVGLAGRTGSGKSTLVLALLSMVEAESGHILIDGVDIARLGLRHLRSKMSVIPQDPCVFSGSVRHNLDPFNTATDPELWEALEAVGLGCTVGALPGKLEAGVADGGANFSLGQRQLLCLARAMLRRSRLLMLDEATASVDVDTDAHIQCALRLHFGDVTCLAVAHRLHTIIDADRVVVLEAGRVVEADEPVKLLDRKESLFRGMVEGSGRSSVRYLTQLARAASLARADSSYTLSGARSSDSSGGSGSLPLLLHQRSIFGTRGSYAPRAKSLPGSASIESSAGTAK